MERDWTYLKDKYGLVGARDKFEDACLSIFKSINEDTHSIKVSKGDGGIDIYQGSLNNNSLVIYQCKYFLENLNSSRISQIQESLIQAITHNKYKLNKWYVCLPKVLSLDEVLLFDKMKERVCSQCNFDINNIKYIAGDELIDYAKKKNVYNKIFDINEALKIDEIHEKIMMDKKTVSIDLTSFSLPSMSNINEYISKYSSDLSGDELKYISFLFQELVLNANKHGFASNVTIIKKHNTFTLIDDGKEFNPILGLNKRTGGGSHTLNHILNNMKQLSVNYKYENDMNKVVISFSNNRSLIDEDCIIQLQGEELFYYETRSALMDEIIAKSKDNNCEEFLIDIIESKMAISHKVEIVQKIINNTSCDIIFKVRDDSFFIKYINEFAEEHNIVNRVRIEKV